jgi:hypothetical protein
MWLMVLATPLLLSGVVAAFVAPFSTVKSGNADSYAAALGQFVGEAWLPLLALVAISLVAAAAAYRRHQRFGLPHPLAWAALVFVFGVPGWIAYRLHRTWPVLEACPACDESTPRDRELCTECGAAFPPPPAKGIEVFA